MCPTLPRPAGPPFMTFHRAFLLELEESLLAVCPDMLALPYWVRGRAGRLGASCTQQGGTPLPWRGAWACHVSEGRVRHTG